MADVNSRHTERPDPKQRKWVDTDGGRGDAASGEGVRGQEGEIS